VSSAGAQANNSSFNAAISADGRYIAFSSAAGNLVAGDINGASDIFVRDCVMGTTECIGKNPNGWSDNPSISLDGRFVAFTSAANNLVAGDTNSKTDVFVCDRSTGSIERANVMKTGTQANNSSFGTAISGDGNYVAFSSPANNLVAGDTNGATDIFVRDRSTGEIERVDVSCEGDQGNGWCGSICVSSNGRFVGFSSFAINLVASDTNNAWDVFIHDRCNDVTAPVTVAALDGTAGENGWFTSDVTVRFAATDNEGGSGVARTEYSFDGVSWNISNGPVVLSSEGQSVVFYRSIDSTGNCEVAQQLAVNIDKTPPVISMLSPLEGAQYLLGQTIPVDWTATDTVSGIATDTVLGIATDTGIVAMGMLSSRSAAGPQSFTVRAVDYAGNVTEQTVTYYIAYDFSGILRPIDDGGHSAFNLGRDLPVKFELKDGDGNPVTDAIARLYLSMIDENGPGEEIAAVSTSGATKDNLFRYDADCGGYIFNLKTKGLSEGNWRLRIEISDGTSKYVDIALR
ncbi:MAG: OmpL47-type beta-barrel domain-containing protein, partial [Candidatus Aquicultor sp.]